MGGGIVCIFVAVSRRVVGGGRYVGDDWILEVELLRESYWICCTD